jgi:putative hydrolase of the HAD superfamily
VRIEAILFDVGGVLVESPFVAALRWRDEHDLPDDLLRVLFGEYARVPEPGEEPPRWHQVETGRLSMAEFVEHVKTSAADQLPPEHRALAMTAEQFNVYASARLHEAVAERARELASVGYRLGIVTNNVREWPEWKATVPLELFEVVVDSCEVGLRKPDPAIFHHTLELLGLEAGAAVFLDDHPANVAAATALGMSAVHVGADLDAALAELAALLEAQESRAVP